MLKFNVCNLGSIRKSEDQAKASGPLPETPLMAGQVVRHQIQTKPGLAESVSLVQHITQNPQPGGKNLVAGLSRDLEAAAPEAAGTQPSMGRKPGMSAVT